MSYILSLRNDNATLENVGGKGMSLTKLLAAGLPVPDGFHVTTEAYRRFVSDNGIQPRIMETLKGIDPHDSTALDMASRQIANFFAAGKIPCEIEFAVSDAYGKMKNAPVAVRSSATAEDLPGASFAGQQETYLNIQGEREVLAAIKRCWASLWTARAISYRLNNHIDQDTVALAVVVQRLIFSDAAGVLFTANPINGSRDELLINAAWGLGEAVVSGLVTPDTIIVKKDTGRIAYRETADKQIMTVRTSQGTKEVSVPDSLKKKPVLSKKQSEELTRLGVKIEQLYQMPMDIEWAMEKGKIFIVQARPITVLPTEWAPPEKKVLYTRGSLAEHLPTPVTPLFSTLGIEIINHFTLELWKEIFRKNMPKLLPDQGIYQVVNGYVYLAIQAKPLLLLVSSFAPRQLRLVLSGSVTRSQDARCEFAAVMDEWEGKAIETFTPSELLEGICLVFGAACKYYTKIQLTLPAASFSEAMFTKLCRGALRRGGESQPAAFLLGFETASLQAEKSLYDICKWADTHPALKDYILSSPAEKLEFDFKHSASAGPVTIDLWTEWMSRIRSHLAKFGRTAFEFDFANPTPQEMFAPVFDAIKVYLSGKGESPYKRQDETVKKREAATQAVLEKTGGPRRWLFLKLLRWAQSAGPMREDGIYDMGMAHPLVRRMLAELGRRFMDGGAIRQVDDIYWLEKPEVEKLIGLLTKASPLPDLSGRIPPRKEQWRNSFEIVPPMMLPEKTGWSKLLHEGGSKNEEGKVVLKGIGTGGGIVTAPACVLFGSEDFGKFMPGDVLVAVTTTPAWTPLFASASAVVTDIGGPLSHSSIVAREYGIPAVMATRSATRAIQTGQMVTVDGNMGTVMLDE